MELLLADLLQLINRHPLDSLQKISGFAER
jgi:hypothetical protein